MRVGGKQENVVWECLQKKLTVGFKMLVTGVDPFLLAFGYFKIESP